MNTPNAGTTTAERLAAMTDRAAFERLALQVLRFGSPLCSSVIRLGTNAQGETIVSPLDGFACVPGATSDQFVGIESTTTDADGLERKWLHDHRTVQRRKPTSVPSAVDDGDLLKAAAQAELLRPRHPGATFTVILATNQIVTSDLRAQVAATARALNVACDVWEQSRIADYLDVDPTGQYLRHRYFGKDIERLSSPLLRDVGRESMRAFAAHARLPSDPSQWVLRDIESTIVGALTDRNTALVLAVGESGLGKTVAAYRVMAQWVANANLGIWLPAHILESSPSIESAVDAVVRDRVPTVMEHCVRSLGGLTSLAPLLVVVDDINKLSRPPEQLRRLMEWATAQSSGGARSQRNIVILCPVWPRFAANVQVTAGVRIVSVGPFEPAEARAALGDMADGEDITRSLAFDPFLIGIYRDLLGRGQVRSRHASQVLDQFISTQLAIVGEAPGVVCTSPEHREATVAMTAASLRLKEMRPTLQHLLATFGDGRLWTATMEILKHSGFVWTHEDAMRVEYRHDRLRDHLLSKGMRRLAFQEADVSAFHDPFFARIAAAAFVDAGVPQDSVAGLIEHSPLVLACAMSLCEPGSDLERRVTEALRAWAERVFSANARVPVRFILRGVADVTTSVHVAGTFNGWPQTVNDGGWALTATEPGTWSGVFFVSVGRHEFKYVFNDNEWRTPEGTALSSDGHGGMNAVFDVKGQNANRRAAFADLQSRAIFREFARQDSQAIRLLSGVLPVDEEMVLLALFRNGDVRAGIAFCASHLGDPGVSFAERRSVFDAASRNYRNQIVTEIRALLPQLASDAEKNAVIRLIGFLKESELVNEAAALWRSSTQPSTLLAVTLWAVLSAGREVVPESILSELLIDLSTLSTTVSHGTSERILALEFLRLSHPRLHSSTMRWLIARASADENTVGLAWHLLDGVDDPAAVEAIARLAGDLDERASSTGGWAYGIMTLEDTWRRGGEPMSTSTRARLWELASSISEKESVRRMAFRLWCAGGPADVDALRIVPRDAPFYSSAVGERARYGDLSVSDEIAERLKVSTRWASVASGVWSQALRTSVDGLLGSWPGEDESSAAERAYDLSELLLRVPAEDARGLLRSYWPRLWMRPYFLHVAIVVGGADLEERIAEAVRTWPSSDKEGPWKHLTIHLHAMHGDEASRIDRATIERLLPYWTQLDEHTMRDLGEAARRRGFASWGREKLAPVMPESVRRAVFPSADDLVSELDETLVSNIRFAAGRQWAERAIERSDGVIDVLQVLDKWLSTNRTQQALDLAANAIMVLGLRAGIETLARHSAPGVDSDRRRIRDVAFVVKRQSLS